MMATDKLRELYSLMLREYNHAIADGCDGNGAYDCMAEAGAAFLALVATPRPEGPE